MSASIVRIALRLTTEVDETCNELTIDGRRDRNRASGPGVYVAERERQVLHGIST